MEVTNVGHKWWVVACGTCDWPGVIHAGQNINVSSCISICSIGKEELFVYFTWITPYNGEGTRSLEELAYRYPCYFSAFHVESGGKWHHYDLQITTYKAPLILTVGWIVGNVVKPDRVKKKKRTGMSTKDKLSYDMINLEWHRIWQVHCKYWWTS